MKKRKEKNVVDQHFCKPEDKIPLKEQFTYGASDIFGGGQAALLSVILMAFLTDIAIIPAAAAGLIISLSKIWDAISDPCMGLITDNTRWSKLGRRKPYMIIGGILIPFGLAFLFAPVDGLGINVAGKITWMVFAYILYCTISTVSQVPYMSMASDISMDYRERNKANTWKLIFDIIAAGLVYLIPTVLWKMVQKPNEMTNPISYKSFYFIIVFGFGLLFAIPLIVGGLTIKERVPFNPDVKVKFNFKEYFEGLKVKSYIWHILMYVTAFLTLDMVSALAPYYTKYIGGGKNVVVFEIFGKTITMGTIMVIAPMMICAAIGILIAFVIKGKYSKQAAYRTMLPLYIIGATMLACYQPSWPAWLIPLFSAIMGIGFAGAQSMPWLIFPDTVDIAELKLGYRPTGNMSGVMTFGRKLATALGVGMVGWVLGGAGYKPELDNEITNASGDFVRLIFNQPDSVAIAIRILLGVSVVLLLGTGYFASIKYKVTDKKLERVHYFIEKRKEGGVESFTAEEKAEYDKLIKQLC